MRTAGRHHRDNLPRHRAVSRHGSTVALTAVLGAALVTGIAGGTAAAANARHHRATTAAVALPAPATVTDPYLADVDAVPPEVLREGGAGRLADRSRPLLTRAPVFAAQDVRLKSRPQATVAAVAGGAAWVNPHPTARVTSCFGLRWGRQHEGVDMAAPDGTPIVAAGAGTVVRAGVAQGYGNAVLIDHGDGWLTHYGHLSVITVVEGQRVAAGQQIGNEGSTGHSTGPHLHFEVHQGFYQNPVEPTAWMHAHGVNILGC
ncbi:M23 family metallopeptidase [Paractinoplanes durhamensis]|uniref:M23 family metallopeptidase n=1 Tax=Paractinoplanes durhamensis TaxID=113563 RepID=UPI001EF302CC|nr:M23 family metallopeptidase [Actinoplanes durhamensis]